MDEFQAAVKEEAVGHILPFWQGMKDQTYGGFYGRMGEDLVIDPYSSKGGITTARHLWSYSHAYNVLGDETYLTLASHAYDFFDKHILDQQEGGMLWMVDYKGEVEDDRKHVYAQAFGIYALSEYYKATKEKTVLDRAYQLFELIESKGYRSEVGTYGEEYTRAWVVKDNEMLSENGVTATITTNTLLHVLEGYTVFYDITQDPRVEEALIKIIELFVHKIWNRKNHHMRVFFDDQWEELIDLKSFGHDIEATWLLDRAIEVVLSHKSADDIASDLFLSEGQQFVDEIAKQIAKVATNVDGSLNNEAENGIVDRNRIWWVQAETLVGFYNMYDRTKDQVWYERSLQVWHYIKEQLVDSRKEGEWHYGIKDDGSLMDGAVVEPWKTPYHNLRACLEIYTRIGKEA